MDAKINKKGQVTIFIILALMIVVVMLILFLLFRGPSVDTASVENPQLYVDSCVKEYTQEALEIISKNGGDLEPEGSVMYNGENRTYLCYNANYYKPCINQRPMLIEHIQDEVKRYIEPKVQSCFDSLKAELEKKNYVVSMGKASLEVSTMPKQVVVDVKNNIRITQREQTQEIKEFKVNVMHPVYELAEIAMEIANQESQYCNFENLGFMIIYPEYDIRKDRIGDSLIYTVREIRTNKDFKFAVRSCAMPAGF